MNDEEIKQAWLDLEAALEKTGEEYSKKKKELQVAARNQVRKAWQEFEEKVGAVEAE